MSLAVVSMGPVGLNKDVGICEKISMKYELLFAVLRRDEEFTLKLNAAP